MNRPADRMQELFDLLALLIGAGILITTVLAGWLLAENFFPYLEQLWHVR